MREQLEQLDGRVSNLDRRAQLTALEARWEVQRAELLGNRAPGGSKTQRASALTMVGMLLAIALFNVVLPVKHEREYQLAFVGFLVLLALWIGRYFWRRAERYERAEREYLEERNRIEEGED